MWRLFRQAHRIIGFNSLGFDIPALKPLAPSDFAKLPHFDILDVIRRQNDGRGAGLNAIAKDTLGVGKVDDPANAIKYWRTHDPESLALLKKYCEADVALTRDIYDFGLKHNYLKFTDRWNNPRQVPVDFSYPKDVISAAQPSLF
jgi:DEAD/DEAH box helicase domain-containing protein